MSSNESLALASTAKKMLFVLVPVVGSQESPSHSLSTWPDVKVALVVGAW